jgi:hypothetical protein
MLRCRDQELGFVRDWHIQNLGFSICQYPSRSLAYSSGNFFGCIPDESPKLIHASNSHIKRDTSISGLVPQYQIVNAGEPRKILPDLAWQAVYALSNGIVCFHKEILEHWVVPIV